MIAGLSACKLAELIQFTIEHMALLITWKINVYTFVTTP